MQYRYAVVRKSVRASPEQVFLNGEYQEGKQLHEVFQMLGEQGYKLIYASPAIQCDGFLITPEYIFAQEVLPARKNPEGSEPKPRHYLNFEEEKEGREHGTE